jgi:hypothetical protein
MRRSFGSERYLHPVPVPRGAGWPSSACYRREPGRACQFLAGSDPSFAKALLRWYSTVRGLRNRRAPISGLESPSLARRAIWVSRGVRPPVVSAARFLTPSGNRAARSCPRRPRRVASAIGSRRFARRQLTDRCARTLVRVPAAPAAPGSRKTGDSCWGFHGCGQGRAKEW